MKKTSKVFGAIALSAALAMGCAVPAFATNSKAPNGEVDANMTPAGTNAQADGVDTDVYVKAKINNISVAVPLKVTIGADAEGGEINAPSGGMKNLSNGTLTSTTGYRIENSSPFMVYIDTVTAKAVNANVWKLDEKRADAASIDTTGASTGALSLTLTPSASSNATSADSGFSGAKNEGNVFAGPTTVEAVLKESQENKPDWALKAKPAGNDAHATIMGLDLAGYSSPLSNVTGTIEAGTEKVFSIKYTVSATKPVRS